MLAQRFPILKLMLLRWIKLRGRSYFNFSQSPGQAFKLHSHKSAKISASSSVIYDHIVCNPPFIKGPIPLKRKKIKPVIMPFYLERTLFRYNQLLSSKGSCSIILPIEYKAMATQEAEKQQLYLKHFTAVKGMITPRLALCCLILDSLLAVNQQN